MTVELCGHATKNGPCNMPKGHEAPFHRHSKQYDKKLYWLIEDSAGNKLDHGEHKVPLNNAISTWLEQHDSLVVRLDRA